MKKKNTNRSVLLNSIFLFFTFTGTSFAQTLPTFEWAKSTGGTGAELTNSVAVDQSGNVYTTGTFDATSDFDPGSGTYTMTPVGGTDVFVTKFNSAGDFIWAKQIGGINSDVSNAVAVDDSGNVFFGGYFMSTADFNPGAGVFNLTASGSSVDIFLCKLNVNGDFVTAFKIGQSGSDAIHTIKLDALGNVYLGGWYQGSSTYDFDPGPAITIPGYGVGQDAFIAKYTNDCQFVWVREATSPFTDQVYSIAIDPSGDVIAAGNFQDTTAFQTGSGIIELISDGTFDGFIWKLSSTGNSIWLKNMARGTSSMNPNSVATDAAGSVYTTGAFGGTTDFDPGITNYDLTSAGSNDIFVSKLDMNGTFVWAHRFGTVSPEVGRSVACDIAGNVYLTGYFNGSIDFDPGAGTSALLATGADPYILKFDGSGGFIWGYKLGGTSNDYGTSITVDNNLSIYTAGYFNTNGDFNQTSGTHILTSAGGTDNFVQKMGQCNPPPAPANNTTSTNLFVCYNESTTLSVNGSGTIGWYTAANGGVYLGSGTNFVTGNLNSSTTFYAQDSTCLQSVSRTAVTVVVNSQMSSSSSGATSICGGTSANIALSAAGGVMPYSYEWIAVSNSNIAGESLTTQSTNTINNTLVNADVADQLVVYNYTVTDSNNCPVSGTVNLTVLTAPVDADVTTVNATCGNTDGSLSIGAINGGTSPYTYSLNGSPFTTSTTYLNLGAGAYTIMVRGSNSCEYTEVAAINNAAAPTDVVLSTTNAKCGNDNGMLSIGNVTGGTGSCTFSINGSPFTTVTSYDSLAGGIYTVIVSDQNNCLYTEPDTVRISVAPSITISSVVDVDCFGNNTGSATAIVNDGKSPFQYTWAPAGFSTAFSGPLIAGTYTLSVQDVDLCIASKTITINQPQDLTLTGSSVNASCGQSNGVLSVNVNGGVSPYAVVWSNNDQASFTDSLSPGSYEAQIIDANGCMDFITLSISAISVPTPEICMVTVDSIGINNIIYWDKTQYASVDTFIVYREITNNNYQIIGKVPFDSLSQFVDTVRTLYFPNTGDPRTTSYKYKISVKDTCGNASALSLFHKTMFLQEAAGNFIWNHYEIEGQSVPIPQLTSYLFLRDNDIDGIYETTIASTTSSSFTDLAYATFQNTADWRIYTNWSIGCEATMRNSVGGNNNVQAGIVKSRSNIKTNRVINPNGIKEITNQSDIKIYPNPASNEVSVVLSNDCKNCTIEIINSLGSVVKKMELRETQTTVNVAELAAGMYSIKISSFEKPMSVQKFIVHH